MLTKIDAPRFIPIATQGKFGFKIKIANIINPVITVITINTQRRGCLWYIKDKHKNIKIYSATTTASAIKWAKL